VQTADLAEVLLEVEIDMRLNTEEVMGGEVSRHGRLRYRTGELKQEHVDTFRDVEVR